MQATIRDTSELEAALLRRGIGERRESSARCEVCGRTLLIGERMYEYAGGVHRCALCRDRAAQQPADSHTVHGPAFGHSIRILDRRARRRAA
ncbi:MAG: hypothetical protein ACP5H2_00485 [Solirubrobacteraceae bacterium]